MYLQYGRQQSLDWTGLEKIVSNTDTNSIGLVGKGHLITNVTL